ncbi:protein of unknown function [Desulfonatronum zhilinae]|nr:protein of unknown function [Desulfonatronum zhilinae]
MARLRVFISSTCYDLDILRGELRPFISGMGYEPVMSDYADVLYDPRSHTHDSCLKEVPSCDMVVLIVGSRFGGTAVPSAFQQLDFSSLEKLSTKSGVLEAKEKLSITQLEVLKAVEAAIPVYAFVDERVLHDHHVYEKNKDKKDVIENIEFPSIQKRETAKYVFEFINFLSHRTTNNNVLAFSRLEDIRLQLASQWSQLFQRLLLENRTRAQESRRYRDFSERIDDLKAVVLASLATPDLRDTAKGAVQFRHLIGFVSNFVAVDSRDLLLSDFGWDDLLSRAGIVELRTIEDDDRVRMMRPEVFMVREDRTFYRFRMPRRALDDFRVDWSAFQRLDRDAREAIVDALLEDREQRRIGTLRYVDRNIDEYLSERENSIQLDLGEAS